MTAELSWPETIFTIFMDEIMIVAGLVGALVASQYKWGFFVFAMVALLWVCWSVVWVARKQAASKGPDHNRVFLICGVWTMFIWFLYPIAWGLSEGGNVIAPDSEVVFYGVLDIMAKPVFGTMLLYGHRRIHRANGRNGRNGERDKERTTASGDAAGSGPNFEGFDSTANGNHAAPGSTAIPMQQTHVGGENNFTTGSATQHNGHTNGGVHQGQNPQVNRSQV